MWEGIVQSQVMHVGHKTGGMFLAHTALIAGYEMLSVLNVYAVPSHLSLETIYQTGR